VGQKVLDDDRQVRDRITRNIQTDLERIHSVPNTNPRAEEDEVLRSGEGSRRNDHRRHAEARRHF